MSVLTILNDRLSYSLVPPEKVSSWSLTSPVIRRLVLRILESNDDRRKCLTSLGS